MAITHTTTATGGDSAGLIGETAWNEGHTASVDDMTYTELLAMKVAGTLAPGSRYRITNFRTIHAIDGSATINTGPEEPLIVTASSPSTLDIIVISEEFPSDIIHYDLVSEYETVTDYTKGRITYRKNSKNIAFYEDWRATKSRRYTTGAVAFNTDTDTGLFPTSGGSVTLSPLCVMTDYAVTKIQFMVNADHNIIWRENNGTWSSPIVPTGASQLVAHGLSFVFADIGTATVDDYCSLSISGEYWYQNWDADVLGYMDFLTVDDTRDPQGWSIICGRTGNPTCDNVIGIGRFLGADVSSNTIILNEYVDRCTTGYGGNVISIGMSNGTIRTGYDTHHVRIGVCCDGTFLNNYCQSICVGDNSSLILGRNGARINLGNETRGVIGSGCSDIVVESSVNDFTIADGLSFIEIRSYDTATKGTINITTSNTYIGAPLETFVPNESSWKITDSFENTSFIEAWAGTQGAYNGEFSMRGNVMRFIGQATNPSLQFENFTSITGLPTPAPDIGLDMAMCYKLFY